MGITVFPEIEAAGGGTKFELISSINLATGTPSSVTFSAIDPKYRVLKLVWFATMSTSARVGIQFNSTTTNYSSHYRMLDAATWAGESGNENGIDNQIIAKTTTATQDFSTFYIYDTNIATWKSVTGTSNVNSTGLSGELMLGLWRNTDIINAVTVLTSAGTFTGGTAFLLGSE